jgi:electron transport complex protein RnfC
VKAERFFGLRDPHIEIEGWQGEIGTLPAPALVRLPLAHPDGTPLEPRVAPGDRVVRGQAIAGAPGHAPLHAPIAGEVRECEPVHTPDGRPVPGIALHAGEEELWARPRRLEEPDLATPEDVTALAVALGAYRCAAPPPPEGAEPLPAVTRIAVLAIDQEPEIAVQRRFLGELREELAEGLRALARLSAEARLLLVVPAALEGDARGAFPDVEIHAVGPAYLQNDRRLALARLVGTGNTTFAAARRDGLLALTAEEAATLGQSLEEGLPGGEKLVTVNAPGLPQPATVRARLGTPVSHLLAELDISVEEGDRVLLGGRLRGEAQFDLEAPITRETDGLTVLRAAEAYCPDEAPCINCGRCVRICPVRIQVNLVARYAEFALIEDAYQQGAHACVECGLCAYVCPARRPLLQYMRFAVRRYHEAEAAAAKEAEAAEAEAASEPVEETPSATG